MPDSVGGRKREIEYRYRSVRECGETGDGEHSNARRVHPEESREGTGKAGLHLISGRAVHNPREGRVGVHRRRPDRGGAGAIDRAVEDLWLYMAHLFKVDWPVRKNTVRSET